MDKEDQQMQNLVVEILSELLEKVALGLEDCLPSANFNFSTSDDNDVQQVVNSLLHKVTEQVTTAIPSISSKTTFKNPSKNVLPEVKWSTLGISQTGRVMDPICLQKNM